MKALLENTGLTFSPDGITMAEIYAYASAIEYVRQYVSSIVSEVFADEYSTGEKYAKLLNLDLDRYTESELKDEIRRRLSMTYGSSTVEEFEDAFSQVGSGAYNLRLDFFNTIPAITFREVNKEDLPQLGRFIEGYIMISNFADFNGNGISWSSWDAWEQSFYRLDTMNLPFLIIDYLRSDLIE